DRTAFRPGNRGDELSRLVEPGAFEEVEAAELLLRLGERAVGDERLAVANADGGRRSGGGERGAAEDALAGTVAEGAVAGGDDRAALAQLVREPRVLAVPVIALLLRHGGPGGLVVVDQQHVLHQMPPSGRFRRYDERAWPESTDAATRRRRSVRAAPLSSISLRLPHFGDWTHDGQPSAHGQPSSIRAVSATQPSNAAKPRSAIPTPPGCPS